MEENTCIFSPKPSIKTHITYIKYIFWGGKRNNKINVQNFIQKRSLFSKLISKWSGLDLQNSIIICPGLLPLLEQ